MAVFVPLRNLTHKSEYKVDGEIGRFKFSLFNVVGPDDVKVFKGAEFWPFRMGKHWYKTYGFKEVALLIGATQCSYRKMTHDLNRRHWQDDGEGTPVATLQDMTEAEGSKVIGFLERHSEKVLQAHQFNYQCAGLKPPALAGQLSAPL